MGVSMFCKCRGAVLKSTPADDAVSYEAGAVGDHIQERNYRRSCKTMQRVLLLDLQRISAGLSLLSATRQYIKWRATVMSIFGISTSFEADTGILSRHYRPDFSGLFSFYILGGQRNGNFQGFRCSTYYTI